MWHFLETPKTYDEIYTEFVQALQTSEDELPEPTTMLEEGFVRTDGKWKRIPIDEGDIIGVWIAFAEQANGMDARAFIAQQGVANAEDQRGWLFLCHDPSVLDC
ncbi:MAG: hypothetical protein P8009_02810 [Gammaproteobacteria bacterium]